MKPHLGVLLMIVTIAAAQLVTGLRAEPAGPPGKAGDEANEVDTEHIFGFADGTDIGEKGEKELEITTIGGFGGLGSYNTVDTETSFRYTVTDQARLSLGTLTDAYAIHDVPGLDNLSAITFSGLIGEARFAIVDDHTHPYGLALSINPLWRQFDPDSGARGDNYAVPLTLLYDVALIPTKLYAAVNLIYTPSFVPVRGGFERTDGFTVITSLSYSIVPKVFLGAEVRHENLLQSGLPDAHALYAGPSLFYQLTPAFSAKVAWAIQVPDFAASGLDLTTYQRHQVDLLLTYSF